MEQVLIPQQFAPQSMLPCDPPRTSRPEISTSGDAVIRFGRFCVLPRARQLLVDGQPLELGSRAFDLLMVLIRSPGTIVTKNEIVSRVWPDTVVVEDNLKVQMWAAKVLNEDRDVVKPSTAAAMCLQARSPRHQSTRIHGLDPTWSRCRPGGQQSTELSRLSSSSTTIGYTRRVRGVQTIGLRSRSLPRSGIPR
jgi:hypothetical protein